MDLIISASQAYIWGFEGRAEEKTDHVQGYVSFKNQRTFTAVKNFLPRAHWEKAKGTERDNYKYCSKEGNFVTNIVPKQTREDIVDLVRQSYANVVWREWQQSLLTMVDSPVDPRAITWVYETTGHVGKTFLAKFLAMRKGTVICQGKGADVFNQVNASIESGTCPKLVLVDVPRVSIDFLSYNAMECLKNGMLYSGKYEGGVCIFPSPHVFCFANEPPAYHKMSQDRWNVFKIVDNKLVSDL